MSGEVGGIREEGKGTRSEKLQVGKCDMDIDLVIQEQVDTSLM